MQKLERILYAEDEPDIQEVALLALETIGGFTVKTCSSGVEVLSEISLFEPQLLLLDVMMPDLDGPGTLKKIREIAAFQFTPAIFMTAKVQADEVQRFLEIGAVDVIAKPFDPMTLSEQIQDIWRRNQS